MLSDKLYLTKCDLIDPIIRAPLCPHLFTNVPEEVWGKTIGQESKKPDYMVCAISAILQDHLDPNLKVQDFEHMCEEAQAFALTKGGRKKGVDLFSELINFFDETLTNEEGKDVDPVERFEVVKYIEENFPDRVLIQIPEKVFIHESPRDAEHG